jgi:hypothetical protein
MRARALYTSNGINYPPVDATQIDAAEARLGFRLPHMLRELYSTVANGADFFKPGQRFYGIRDGRSGSQSNIPTIEDRIGQGQRTITADTVELLHAHIGSYVMCKGIPMGFVALAQIGGGIYVFLDGFTGHIYVRDTIYENNVDIGEAFSLWALSVEEWVERELALPPADTSEVRYLPHYDLATLAGNKDENEANRDGETPSTNGHSPGEVFVVSQSEHKTGIDSGVSNAQRHLRVQFKSMREDIIQQIHQFDMLGVSAKDIANSRLSKLVEKSQVIQRLADAEAQIYALEEDALFP